jgi:hypothetical protein
MKNNSNISTGGYHKFHQKQVYNFQLNRFYSSGYAKFEDMVEAGNNIKNYEDWKPEMVRIADKALKESRLINAAIYYRAAEFYTLPKDPDKEFLHDKFNELFSMHLRKVIF